MLAATPALDAAGDAEAYAAFALATAAERAGMRPARLGVAAEVTARRALLSVPRPSDWRTSGMRTQLDASRDRIMKRTLTPDELAVPVLALHLGGPERVEHLGEVTVCISDTRDEVAAVDGLVGVARRRSVTMSWTGTTPPPDGLLQALLALLAEAPAGA